MNIKAFEGNYKEFQGEALVFLILEGEQEKILKDFEDLKDIFQDFITESEFKAKKEEILKIPVSIIAKEKFPFKKIYLVGLGKKEKLSEETLREVSAKVAKTIKKDKVKKLLIINKAEKSSQPIVEGLILGSYEFNKYKSKKEEKEEKLEEIYISPLTKEELIWGKVGAIAQNFVRDLVNTPPNEINPKTFAEIAKRLAEEYGFEIDIKPPEWVKENMPGLWYVGKGSANKPYFVHIKFKGKNPKKKIAFVGKGLTYDSGGLNIKPEQFMKTMKMDKAGACAVLGIFKALGELKKEGIQLENLEIEGFMGLAENMPDGEAYKPDDIIRMRNGKTVEVHNTDAEGRITLGDVLTYACEQNPEKLVDMATLTGACIVALGEYTAGLFGNNEEFIEQYLRISKKTGERMWNLPMDDELLKENLKGDFADIANLAKTRYGGAITAAMFLQEFVKENIKWIHIDIAGPAWANKPYKYHPQVGGTGFGVRTALFFLKEENEKV